MTVHLAVDDGVAVITLDRPDALNAVNIESLKALRAHLSQVRDDDNVRAIVLTATGTRAFCAGADLKGTRESQESYARATFRTLEVASERGLYVRLIDLTDLAIWKPIIAAVNGHCLGAGLELALQCDIRIASLSASFGLPEATVGSIPAVSGLHRLLKAVPSAHAMQMALTGTRIDAQRALAIGLVSEAVSSDELHGRAVAIARAIANNAPLAVQAIKKLSRQTAHLSEADAQHLTELYWGVLRDTHDRVEGRSAFAEKRRPKFIGA
jgi:E-phenylitaconyl-CoA hydratase